MTMTIEEKVIALVADQLEMDADDLDETQFLTDDLDADPNDLEEIASSVAEEFDIEVTEEDYEGWERIGDVIAFVHEKLRE
ncbi:MAG: acyl carrier protein [Deltaproteobacteria bacterium]|nr:acyl carrier protein [Deltaproteobacteria bacterium]